MSLTFVQGDTGPDLYAVLHDLNDATSILSLVGVREVRFQMRKADDRRFTVNAAATVMSDTGGQVKYTWGANDLAVPGTYNVQWQVTFSDNTVQTTVDGNQIVVQRR